MKLKLLSSILTLCFFGMLSAQNYPVTVVPQAVSPSPIYLSSYADAGTVNSPLRVQLLLNDITLSNVEVRLKTYFEGNGIRFESNNAVVGANPIYLEGGVPVNLTNIQLAPFYSLQNISGINSNQYAQPIPEGSYQFCFEVYDAFTGNRLSARSCATTYIFKNEPPFLILPRRDETIDVINPQNIVFQWTPRHINVSNVEYELSIVEIWDNYVDPQAAFFSMPPIFQATTRNTSYLLGPADPMLLPNKKYAWRVQAKAIAGTEEIGLFNNNGYSEIFWFSHSQPCEVPANVRHEVKGTHQANIEWDDFSTEIPEYTVRYRERTPSPSGGGREGEGAWFYSRSNTNWVTIWDLRPGTTYEYQVNRKCQLIESEYSPVKTFTTFLADDESGLYNCGISPEINITNADPLPDLFVNDVFKAGDFPIKVLEVSGSNGRFTGKGYVSMPYLKNIKVAVEFTNVLINTDKNLIEGMVITKYDPTWSNILDTDGVIDSAEDITDVFTGGDNTILDPVEYDIESVTIKDGQIVVTGTNGEQTTYDYDEGDTYQISGTNGVFAIDENGNVSQIGETAEGGPATAENTEGINPSGNGTVESPSVAQVYTEGATVIFRKGSETKYELDMVDNSFEQSTYPKAQRSDGKDYYPVHKAVVNGNKDVFYADITITNNEINIDSLVFKTVETGLKLVTEKVDNDTYKIEVEGRNAYRNEEAIITYKDATGKQIVLASFFIHHLHKLQTRKVQIVSVNGASPIEGLEETLNTVFGVAGASFDVNSDIHEINISPSVWDIDEKNDVLDYNGSGLLPDYPKEIRAIHQYYMANTANYDAGAYYVFLVDGSMKVSKPINGFMPKGRQFGYIFNAYQNQGLGAKDEQDKVVAHELGHGVFSLEHPFESDSNAGNTKWLMNYADGTQLPFAHWAVMSETGLNLQLFQPDEEGELSTNEYPVIQMLTSLSKNSGYKHFALKHCKDCNSNTSQTLIDSPYKSIKIEELSSEVQEYLSYGTSETNQGDLVGYQLVSDGKGKKCIILYYQSGASIDDADTYITTPQKQGIKEGLWLIDLEYKEEIDCSSYDNNLNFCSFISETGDYNFSVNYLVNLYDAINKCTKEESQKDISEIRDLLISLKVQVRVGQGIEFAQNGKVYQLNSSQQAVEVKDALKDEQINLGNWQDGDELKMRFTFNDKNILQLQAFGFKNNLPLASGKQDTRLVDLSLHIKSQTNTFFSEYSVRNTTVTPQKLGKNLNDDGKTFADGDNMNIDNNASFIKIMSEGVGVVTSLLKTAEVEKNVYLEEQKGNTTIHAPGLVTGTVEAGATVFTDLTSLGVMVYDLATSKETRKKAYDGLVKLKTATGDNPKAMIPMFVEVLSAATTGNTTTEWQEINSESTDNGRKSHLSSRGVVTTVKTIFAAGTLITKLDDIVEGILKKLDDITEATGNALTNLRALLKDLPDDLLKKLDEWKSGDLVQLDKYLEKYKDLVKELKDPKIFEAVEKIIKNPESAWDVLKESDLYDTVVEKLGKSAFFKEVVAKGREFEELISNTIIKNKEPFKSLLSGDYKHLKQIHLKGKLNKIISDDLFVKKEFDEILEIDYYRAVINDTKLTKNSPWTPNQKEELIKAFENTNKPYLEFDVRTAADKLPINSPVTTGDIIRIYKEDIFKIIGDGNGAFEEVIQIFK